MCETKADVQVLKFFINECRFGKNCRVEAKLG
jgi:hypothetical protein